MSKNTDKKVPEKELLDRIQELENENAHLEKDLIHDHLTGLKTRKFFEEELSTYLESINTPKDSRRKESFGFRNISVVFFDIDYFKKINDTYGHLAGDEVLKTVASGIRQSLREGDTASRWGGEEIAVILLGASEKDARKKAEEVRELISNLSFSNKEIKVSISAGVVFANKGATVGNMVNQADKALYNAKETGRNKVVSYSEIA